MQWFEAVFIDEQNNREKQIQTDRWSKGEQVDKHIVQELMSDRKERGGREGGQLE